jgi:hypothetical protein
MPAGLQEKNNENKERHSRFAAIRNVFRIDETKDTPWTQLSHSGPKFFLGLASAAFTIGFPRYFNNTVEFLAFPDVLDSLGMIIIGAYIVAGAVHDAINQKETNWGYLHNVALRFSLGIYDVAFAMAFPQYFDKPVYFSSTPNVLGIVATALSATYLLVGAGHDIKKRLSAHNEAPDLALVGCFR